jgi:hypothetical protein
MTTVRIKIEPSDAINDVLVERIRQLAEEGFDAAHDDTHEHGELSAAATCYVMWATNDLALEETPLANPPAWWPWDRSWWKPSEPRRNLVKAAALILAEIERLDRASQTDGGSEHG